MPSAEIITIGTELLLGEITDTNAPTIARALRDNGIDLYRKTSIGDNARRIATAVNEALGRCDIVITTGGLGPTIDDPTREAIALAFDVPIEFHPELWQQIQERFQRYRREPTENNRRQAYIPQGATAIENPVGTAPAFIVDKDTKIVISLPGVPREMEYLLEKNVIPYLREHLRLSWVIKTRLLHTAGIGESIIDERLQDLEKLTNPTLGLAAHSGQVDVRIAAKAESADEAGRMILSLEEEVRRRLGDWIYGSDAETLEEIAIRQIQQLGWRLVVVEMGTRSNFSRKLAPYTPQFAGGLVLAESIPICKLEQITHDFAREKGAEVGLGILLTKNADEHRVDFCLVSPNGSEQLHKNYGGPPDYAPLWALNNGLDLIRHLT